MRLRTSLYLLALLFLFGCSGGGSSSAGGGVPAPPPGPQLVSMKLDVEVLDQAQRSIQGRSGVIEVVAEVVDRNSLDTGTLSGRKVISRGAATVGDTDRTVKILLDIIPGIWDIYIFGLDSEGKVVALSTIDQLTITPGVVLEQRVSLQSQSRSVFVNPSNAAIQVGQQQQFSALVFLPTGNSTSVNWASDNPAVATVDANGLATGLAAGVTTIRATSTVDNSLQGSAQLTVAADNNARLVGLYTVALAGTSADGLDVFSVLSNLNLDGAGGVTDAGSGLFEDGVPGLQPVTLGLVQYSVANDGTVTFTGNATASTGVGPLSADNLTIPLTFAGPAGSGEGFAVRQEAGGVTPASIAGNWTGALLRSTGVPFAPGTTATVTINGNGTLSGAIQEPGLPDVTFAGNFTVTATGLLQANVVDGFGDPIVINGQVGANQTRIVIIGQDSLNTSFAAVLQ